MSENAAPGHDAAGVQSAPSRDVLGLDLRIAEIRATIVNLPLVAPYHWAAGLYPGVSRVVIEVETRDGVIGLGEAPHWHCAASIDELRPRLVGRDAYDLQQCRTWALPPIGASVLAEGQDLLHAYGGIEMALWDLRARASGVPLYALLGGAARTEIPFTEYFAAREPAGDIGGERSPDGIAAYCARMIEQHGATCFEGKVGYADLETDLAVVRAVREAIGPQRVLRLDANGGWQPETAREALRRLGPYNIANIEDPVGSFEEMARLRRHTDIPFSTHTPDLRHAIALGAPDTFVLNVMALGGIQPTLKFIAACEATGHGFWFHSGDSGIGVAAYLQLAAAEPYLSRPSQSLLRWYADDIIAGGPFVQQNGVVRVPEGPGLGVTLDKRAMARCHQRFRDDGPIELFRGRPDGAYYTLPRY